MVGGFSYISKREGEKKAENTEEVSRAPPLPSLDQREEEEEEERSHFPSSTG